jgi:hypothetical protein
VRSRAACDIMERGLVENRIEIVRKSTHSVVLQFGALLSQLRRIAVTVLFLLRRMP